MFAAGLPGVERRRDGRAEVSRGRSKWRSTTPSRAEQVMPPVGVSVSSITEMQKFLQEKTVTPSPGQRPRMTPDSAEVSAASVTWMNAEPDTLMERVLAPANLKRAYQRVVSNKGAPGADGMTVADLAGYVRQYWPTLKARLLAGEYQPQAVRAVEIPKPQGGTRQLGIPSVVDRLIQQALQQQLTPIFDPLFSDYSYGFRPGRSAHQAIEMARAHVAAGYRWSVELDLEKFFDRVDHDLLMDLLARQVEDPRVRRLVRRYLEEGGDFVDGKDFIGRFVHVNVGGVRVNLCNLGTDWQCIEHGGTQPILTSIWGRVPSATKARCHKVHAAPVNPTGAELAIRRLLWQHHHGTISAPIHTLHGAKLHLCRPVRHPGGTCVALSRYLRVSLANNGSTPRRHHDNAVEARL